MADQPLPAIELLNKRLALVARISLLNAEALKLTQRSGAVDMERLHVELTASRGGRARPTADDLREVEAEADAIRTAQVDCEARTAAAEGELEAIDRLLERFAVG